MKKLQTEKSRFILLWLLCIVGSWGALPYAYYIHILSPSSSLAVIFLVATIQAAVCYGIVCWLSYLLLPKTDLMPLSTPRPLRKIAYPGAIIGAAVGICIWLLDRTIFKSSLLSSGHFEAHPPAWVGMLASFYGAINEEVLLRLFFFTLVYFLLKKVCRFEGQYRLRFLWITNVIVALLFGLAHLPAAFKLGASSSFEISRILVLNGIPGLFFGWLYWSRGLWAAMIAHFVADLAVHVFGL